MKNLISIVFFLFLLKSSIAQKALELYGGSSHDIYLGCLNCNNYSSNSIWNEYGTYGSKYNSKSIWNSYGTYGSNYSSYSPFNSYASYPPVIVDQDGGFYGYFTINEYKAKRADSKLALTIYKYHESIREDVGVWYDKIFN